MFFPVPFFFFLPHIRRCGEGSWRPACDALSPLGKGARCPPLYAPAAGDPKAIPARLHINDDETGQLTFEHISVCSREPTFGDPADRIKRRCARHALPTDVAVNLRVCESPGCMRRALYGDPSQSKSPLRCGEHIRDGDEDMYSTRCAAPGCNRLALYGLEHNAGRGELFCGQHREPEHVRVRAISENYKLECVEPGCSEQARFGPTDDSFDDESSGDGQRAIYFRSRRRILRCKKHKLPDDLSANMLRLLRSDRICTHTYDAPSSSSSSSASAPSTHITSRLHSNNRCSKPASYGDPATGKVSHCREHKPKGFVNVTTSALRRLPILHRHLIQLFDGANGNYSSVPLEEFGMDPAATPGPAAAPRGDDEYSSTFTYLLVCMESRDCIVIDPVLEQVERDATIISSMNLNLVYAVNTHVHADHITGTAELRARFPGMQTAISRASGARADVLLDPHETIYWGRKNKGASGGTRELRCLPTPGHTAGCMSFYDPHVGVGGSVFTGDALLIGGCGRTDFQGGDARVLYRSVHEELFTLDERATVYPGHDYAGLTHSSIQMERDKNPRLGGSQSEESFVAFMDARKMPYPKRIDEAVPANMICGEF